MADLRGHGEVEGEESDIAILYSVYLMAMIIPGTQSEVIKALERSVENLSMTSLSLNWLQGVGGYDKFAVERNQLQ